MAAPYATPPGRLHNETSFGDVGMKKSGAKTEASRWPPVNLVAALLRVCLTVDGLFLIPVAVRFVTDGPSGVASFVAQVGRVHVTENMSTAWLYFFGVMGGLTASTLLVWLLKRHLTHTRPA